MHELISYFHISWLSTTDGPGKRVVLFLQGCPLNCLWCHSPHSQLIKSPLQYTENLCSHCRRCEEVCSEHVHQFINEQHLIDRSKCIQCGQCVESCPQSSLYAEGNALSLPTKIKSVGELFKLLQPQLDLLHTSGGITFSGGEPLLQVTALTRLAQMCKANGIATALETSGIVPLRSIKKIAPWIDTWLFGVRLTTGTSNYSKETLYQKTNENYQYLKSQNANIHVRIPAIPGFTDQAEYLEAIHSILESNPPSSIEVLPFNRDTDHYYQTSGLSCHYQTTTQLAEKAFNHINQFFNS